jgi:hypothetical protein
MTLDEAIKRYKSDAEYERTHGDLQGRLEFRQLVEWLRRYQKIQEIVEHWACCGNASSSMIAISEVLDGDD